MADDADELFEMTKRAERENAELIRRRSMNADQDTARMWSNEGLNKWLKTALASERELILNAVAEGMQSYHENLSEEIEPEVIALKNRVKKLEAEIDELKKAKKGWFS